MSGLSTIRGLVVASARKHARGGVAKNVGWLLSERLVRLLVAFFVGALTARYLGPGRYGEIAYALAFAGFFGAVAGLGADAIVVRDLVRFPEEKPQLLGTLIVTRAALGIACWALSIVLTLAFQGPHAAILMSWIGSSLLFQATDSIDLWFQTQLQSRRTVAAKLPAYLLVSVVRVLLVVVGAPTAWFAAAIALEGALAATFLVIAYRRYPIPGRLTFAAGQIRRLVRDAFPFLISAVSVMVYMRVDQIMLGQMKGEHALGIFAAALPLSQLWLVIPVTITTSLAPRVAELKVSSEADYRRMLLTIYRGIGALALVYSAVTAIAAPWIVPLLYGPAYAETVPVLIILSFTNIPIALGVAQTLWLANESAGSINVLKTMSGGVVAIVCNLVLIPRYGALGAAYATLAAMFVSAIASNFVLAPDMALMQIGINGRLPWRRIVRVGTDRPTDAGTGGST